MSHARVSDQNNNHHLSVPELPNLWNENNTHQFLAGLVERSFISTWEAFEVFQVDRVILMKNIHAGDMYPKYGFHRWHPEETSADAIQGPYHPWSKPVSEPESIFSPGRQLLEAGEVKPMPETNIKLWLTAAWLGSLPTSSNISSSHHCFPTISQDEKNHYWQIYIHIYSHLQSSDDCRLHCNGSPGTTLPFLAPACWLIHSSAHVLDLFFPIKHYCCLPCNKLWQS